MITPRQYQLDAVDRLRETIAGGDNRVIFCLPTGGGKTVVAVMLICLALAKGMRVLFIAHRRELLDQAYRKVIGCTCSLAHVHGTFEQDPTCANDGVDEKDVGIIMAGDKRRRPTARVQIASIDTLRNKTRKPDADLIIIDECHRTLAKSYVDLVNEYPADTNLIGLSATPCRGDGKALRSIYSKIVMVASVRELIDQGHLVEPRVYTVPQSQMPDLSNVRVSRGGEGDYNEHDLAQAMDQNGLVDNIVERWLEVAGGRTTVLFAAGVAHSQHLADRFVAAGVKAEHLDGETEVNERAAILKRLATGETTVLCNVGVCTEGWDLPKCKCAILARPTKSRGLCLQMAGRILRPWQGQTAVILDHAGVIREHGFPQDDQHWSLEEPKKRKPSAEVKTKTCPTCYAVLPSLQRECWCGYSFVVASADTPEKALPVEDESTKLVEAKPATVDERRLVWERLKELVDEGRISSGKASHLYREQYKVWPSNAWGRAGEKAEIETGASPLRRAEYLADVQHIAAAKGYKPGFCSVKFKERFGQWPTAADLKLAVELKENAA